MTSTPTIHREGANVNTAEQTTQFDDTIEVRGLARLTISEEEMPDHVDLTIRTRYGEYTACISQLVGEDGDSYVDMVHDADGNRVTGFGSLTRGSIHEGVTWTLTSIIEQLRMRHQRGQLHEAS